MKFTESHEWIIVDGSEGTVGITGKAQEELGEVVHVELPRVGKRVKAGEEVAVLESTKAAADIYSPVSGEISAINPELAVADKINSAPEGEGWLFKIRLADPQEVEKLLSRAQYLALAKP